MCAVPSLVNKIDTATWSKLHTMADATLGVRSSRVTQYLYVFQQRSTIEYVRERNIYTKVPIKECWDKTGKGPVSTRWVDRNKAEEGESMDIRSRLVGRDFRGGEKDCDDLLAETPPLEGKRMLLSRAATRKPNGRFRKLMFIDVKKTHLNLRCEEDVYTD